MVGFLIGFIKGLKSHNIAMSKEQFIFILKKKIRGDMYGYSNMMYHRYHKEVKDVADRRIVEELDNIADSQYIICTLNGLTIGLLKLVDCIEDHFGELYKYMNEDANRDNINLFVEQYYNNVDVMINNAISAIYANPNAYTYYKDVDLFKLN
jgi:hypothetical protein